MAGEHERTTVTADAGGLSAGGDAISAGAPTRIDEYRLVRMLGRGGMGQVWLAHDTLLDRQVAIKLLAVAPSAAARERFRREARAIARLSHPNVVTIHRVGEVDETPYLVSELVTGQSLDLLARPVPAARAAALALGLARGLAAAHRAGILHRDIKPANAILSESGEVKLLDFGLAKLRDGDGEPAAGSPAEPGTVAGTGEPEHAIADTLPVGGAIGDTTPAALTRTGALLGTPLYMAPEVWAGGAIDERADVYSLGALVWELCAGRPLHEGDSPHEVRKAALAGEPRRLDEQAAGFDGGLAAVIARCLRRDPALRFASGEELQAALEPVAARLDRGARSRRRWLAPVALVVAIAAAVIGWAATRGSPAPRRPPRTAPVRVAPAATRRCSADGWCWQADPYAGLTATWSAARDQAWAVGVRGTIRHFDGRGWTTVDGGTVADLWSVRGSAADDVWAVGDWGTVLHWDGTTWSSMMTPSRLRLLDVYAVNRDDAWIVGEAGTILHWDGQRWQAVPSGVVAMLLRIAGTGPGDMWISDNLGTVYHWDGHQLVRSINTGDLTTGLWAGAPDDAWAVGFHSSIHRWNGTRWAPVPVPDVVPVEDREDHPFNSTFGTGPDDVWLVAKKAPILHWDGARWQSASWTTRELFGIGGTAKDDVWVVGNSGVTGHYDGARWSVPEPEPVVSSLRSLWGSAADDVWGAGYLVREAEELRGRVEHFDGVAWKPIAIDAPVMLRAITGSGPDDVWVTGVQGTVQHWGGRRFAPVTAPATGDLRGAVSIRPGEAWVVGEAGIILRCRPDGCAAVASGTTAVLDHVWSASPDDAWAVGDGGTIVRWDGVAWRPLASGTTRYLRGVWGLDARDVWVVGDGGVALHWDGARLAPTFVDSTEQLMAVWGSRADDIWAVADPMDGAGGLVHWNGRFWTTLERTPRAGLRAIWGANADDVWVTGDGSLLHREAR